MEIQKALLNLFYILSILITDLGELRTAIDQDLVTFARQALLDVVRARYMDSIHTGGHFI